MRAACSTRSAIARSFGRSVENQALWGNYLLFAYNLCWATSYWAEGPISFQVNVIYKTEPTIHALHISQ